MGNDSHQFEINPYSQCSFQRNLEQNQFISASNPTFYHHQNTQNYQNMHFNPSHFMTVPPASNVNVPPIHPNIFCQNVNIQNRVTQNIPSEQVILNGPKMVTPNINRSHLHRFSSMHLPSNNIIHKHGAQKLGLGQQSNPIITDIERVPHISSLYIKSIKHKAVHHKITNVTKPKQKKSEIKFIKSVDWQDAHKYDQYCPFCVRDECNRVKSEFWSKLPAKQSMDASARKHYDDECKQLLKKTENSVKQNVTFKSAKSYREHYDKSHKNYGLTCIYDGCLKQSSSWYNFVAHLTQHDRENGRPFYCIYKGCNRKSSTKHNLIKHIQGIHKWKIINHQENTTKNKNHCFIKVENEEKENTQNVVFQPIINPSSMPH